MTQVLLCTGLGLTASSWDPVVDELEHAALCVDRVNLPHDRLRRPLRLDDEVDRLRLLCGGRRSVAVGHSFGGLFVEALARRHPELVSGLVLVDASVELGRLPASERALHRLVRRLPRLLPKPRRMTALAWELEAYLPVALELQQWRRTWPMPDVPVEIVTAVLKREEAVDWVQQQRELADLMACDPPGRTAPVRQVNVKGTHLLMTSAPMEVAASIERVIALADPTN